MKGTAFLPMLVPVLVAGGLVMQACASQGPRPASPPPAGKSYDEYLRSGRDKNTLQPVAERGKGSMAIHGYAIAQGRASVLEFPCGLVVVDTGLGSTSVIQHIRGLHEQRPELAGALASVWVSSVSIEAVGGVAELLKTFGAESLIDNGDVRATPAGQETDRYRSLLGSKVQSYRDISVNELPDKGASGETIDTVQGCGQSPIDPIITGLWGSKLGREELGQVARDFALAMRVDYGKQAVLLLNDMSSLAAARFLARYKASPELLRADVLILSGASPALLSEGMAQAVQPKVVIYADGTKGLDRAQLLELQARIPMYRTKPRLVEREEGNVRVDSALYSPDWDGDLSIEIDGKGSIREIKRSKRNAD